MARVIEVIEAHECEGQGTSASPSRIVVKYYSRDGKLLAYHDDWEPPAQQFDPKATMYDIKKEVVLDRLARFDDNRERTAKSLGLAERTLYRLLQEYKGEKS